VLAKNPLSALGDLHAQLPDVHSVFNMSGWMKPRTPIPSRFPEIESNPPSEPPPPPPHTRPYLPKTRGPEPGTWKTRRGCHFVLHKRKLIPTHTASELLLLYPNRHPKFHHPKSDNPNSPPSRNPAVLPKRQTSSRLSNPASAPHHKITSLHFTQNCPNLIRANSRSNSRSCSIRGTKRSRRWPLCAVFKRAIPLCLQWKASW
jgi:hypothetical protein